MDAAAMKNYIVWSVSEIAETESRHGIEAAGTPGVFDSYQRMAEISVLSARHNVRGQWQAVINREPASTRTQLFVQNYWFIHELWLSEPCNILFLDADTVVTQPVELFDRWPQFRLFNWTTPPRSAEFLNYFNSAVRYYPHSMARETWQLGHSLVQAWRDDIWDWEQQIYNHMFWSQKLSWRDAHHPELNWQAATGGVSDIAQHTAFNSLPPQHARIIHYHGTRSHQRGQQLAQDLAQAAEIPL